MTGLLRKDLYYMKAYAWPYLPLLALLCLSPGAMGPAYTMALALALPRMTIANDERRWDRYAVMTPLRAELVVAEKYLLHLACIALAAACMALSFPAQNAALRLMGRTEAMWGAELNLPAYVLIQVWLGNPAAPVPPWDQSADPSEHSGHAFPVPDRDKAPQHALWLPQSGAGGGRCRHGPGGGWGSGPVLPGERGILPGPSPGTLRLRRGIVRRKLVFCCVLYACDV